MPLRTIRPRVLCLISRHFCGASLPLRNHLSTISTGHWGSEARSLVPITCVDCAFNNLYDLPKQDACIISTRTSSQRHEPCVHTALLKQFALERQGKYSRLIDVWGPPSQSSALILKSFAKSHRILGIASPSFLLQTYTKSMRSFRHPLAIHPVMRLGWHTGARVRTTDQKRNSRWSDPSDEMIVRDLQGFLTL